MPSAPAAPPLTRDLQDIKGDISVDSLSGNLADELLPEFRADAAPLPGAAPPFFPAVDELLGLFNRSCKDLVDLRRQIDGRLQNLDKEVAAQDARLSG